MQQLIKEFEQGQGNRIEFLDELFDQLDETIAPVGYLKLT